MSVARPTNRISPDVEHVVLLDDEGRATGIAEKFETHHGQTPLHLAFSCYIFDDEGRVLVSRRALTKKVFPGVWTNSVCGHPAAGETLEAAVHRRAERELGLEIADLRVVLPEFQYRAEMQGVVENEKCPVLVARAVGNPHPAADEVDDVTWVPWSEFTGEVLGGTREISPWAKLQIAALDALGPDPTVWPTGDRALLPPALRDVDWWKSAVVYQIYPRSFQDSDGDGIGDLRGIINRLDYLQQLGVDVIWLSPAYRSPQDDNGYDISDYQDIDPVFGTLADMDELISGLHARGMRLVMDLVVNHTSDEHAWFVESRDPQSPKRDWYWWRAPRDGVEPNDWRSFFSGPAWEFDERSGEYFLHLFSRKQPDLNWENPEVRQAVYAMMRWWLDRGVDGFRMDVINLISKNLALPDGDMFWHVVNGPRMHEFLQEMHREVLAGRNLITVGEMPGVNAQWAADYTDPAAHELNMVFTFEHMDLDSGPGGKWDLRPLQLPDLKASLARWQSGLLERGWNSLYWNNHDQPRIVSRWGNDREHRVQSAKAFATVLHLLRGTPYIYQGEEFGMTNAGFSEICDYRDIEALNHAREALAAGAELDDVMRSLMVKGRDNARTPVQWDASPNAGFTTGTPWIAVNDNHREINAAAAVADPESVFHHYRRLIELRHALPVVVHGDFTLLAPDDTQVFAYIRRWEGASLLVAANLSDDTAHLADAALGAFVNGERLVGEAVFTAAGVGLAPWQAFAILV